MCSSFPLKILSEDFSEVSENYVIPNDIFVGDFQVSSEIEIYEESTVHATMTSNAPIVCIFNVSDMTCSSIHRHRNKVKENT